MKTETKEISLEEMLNLAEKVRNWKATCIGKHDEETIRKYPFLMFEQPTVYGFKGSVGKITLDLESSSANSWFRWYRITAQSHLQALGHYKEKEGKCAPRLMKLYSILEQGYAREYLRKVKKDLKYARGMARKV